MSGSLKLFRRRKSFPIHIVVFLAPAVIIYSVFFIYPLLNTIRLSFYTTIGSGTPFIFNGIHNFVVLLTSDTWAPEFWNGLKNNVEFFVIAMVVQNTFGLLLALALNARILKGRAIYRTLLFTPAVLSVVIVGFIWQLMLSPLWGIVLGFLKAIGLESLFRPWLGLESSVFVTICLISCWQFVGVPMMLFLTSLLGISEEVIEAATVDGASAWQRFWGIQLPLIMPTVGIVTILTYTGTLNAFDLMFALKGILGDPNFRADVMGLYYYRTYFGTSSSPGNPTMGATIAVMIFLIILAGVLVYLFTWQRRNLTIEG
jgi:raffinose/stachyose/melibiose transport system permease protein